MNWYQNLNVMPRLMIGFAVMIALTIATGYWGVISFGNANDRLGVLYQRDMKGSTLVNDIIINRMEVGRQVWDAMLKIDNPAATVAS